ncbi:hypothetical protein DOTSEDRAFT_23016 [Dothistroma septosporum NZE10]|uniref:Uncharacterized protein n=1 Tax=Dothistroma septosporum (strain NZE10 / CBS 128990) TaxID=675120 RepID=N1PPP4_DOTSN|nr:hypothetical protein DOTSEDRAFT_23016 [Dothistroma septosporum NZE10]
MACHFQKIRCSLPWVVAVAAAVLDKRIEVIVLVTGFLATYHEDLDRLNEFLSGKASAPSPQPTAVTLTKSSPVAFIK